MYLASQNEDSVDVGKDAMKTEVNVRSDQRKNWREDTGARLELRNKIKVCIFKFNWDQKYLLSAVYN